MATSTGTTEKTYSFDRYEQTIKNLFSSDTADIHFTFRSDEEGEKQQILDIGAHKALLSAMSSVFKAWFDGNWKDDKIIEIRDSSFDAFNAFLQYFYTNKVHISENNVGEMLYLADFYDIPDIKASCSSFMEDRLQIENVLGFFALTVKFRLKQLTSKCKDIISTDTAKILRSPELLHCTQDELMEILSIDKSTCAEEEIFDVCIKWARAKCAEQELDANGENLRKVLGTCFDRIRFKEMGQSEFFERLGKYKEMFMRDEIVDIVTQPVKNGVKSFRRYQKPFSHVFKFGKSSPEALDPYSGIIVSHSVKLKAFSLPKLVFEDYYGQINDQFIGKVLHKTISSSGFNQSATSHQFKRAKLWDDDETYCFSLVSPITLLANEFHSIYLNSSITIPPVTYVVSTKTVDGVTLHARYWRNHVGLMGESFITYFAALYFQK